MSETDDEDFLIDKADDPIASIGQIVVGFQGLENTLVDILAAILGNHEYALIFASNLSFSKLADTVEHLLKVSKAHSYKHASFVEVRKELGQIEQERNTFIHSNYSLVEWTSETKRYVRSKISSKDKKIKHQFIANRKIFTDLIERIEAAQWDLYDLELTND